jgi:hypothetical protein
MSGWLSRLFDTSAVPQDYTAPANQLGPLARQVMANPVGTETTSPYASQSVGVPSGPFNPIEAMTTSGQPILGTDMDRARAAVAQGMQEAPAMVLGMVGDAPGGKGFTAYHGSPHDFSAFDTSKIGTGEGAQAYGHGLYFAENEGVAKGYRDQLAPQGFEAPTLSGDAKDWLRQVQRDVRNATLDDVREYAHSMHNPSEGADFPSNQVSAEIHQALDEGKIKQLSSGHMYEVNVNADPAHFLDWDKPLSEQHPVVQKALGQLGVNPPPSYSVRPVEGGHVVDFRDGDQQWTVPRVYQSADEAARQADVTKQLMSGNPTGRDIHDQLSETLHTGPKPEGGGWTMVTPERYTDPAAAAQALRDAGVPGIRYLDAGSRGAGSGTYNHVVFDANTIEILRKYGIAGLLGGTGAVAGTQQPSQ